MVRLVENQTKKLPQIVVITTGWTCTAGSKDEEDRITLNTTEEWIFMNHSKPQQHKRRKKNLTFLECKKKVEETAKWKVTICKMAKMKLYVVDFYSSIYVIIRWVNLRGNKLTSLATPTAATTEAEKLISTTSDYDLSALGSTTNVELIRSILPWAEKNQN